MSLVDSLYANFSAFFPIFLRVSTFILAVPLFGRGVPSLLKVGLSGLITFLLLPVVPTFPVTQDLEGYLFACVEQILIGLAMGLVVTIVVGVVYLAGQLIDVPIGFSMVNVIDPQTGQPVPVMSQFHYVLAILVLFVVNGHHTLLAALAQSFTLIPVGEAARITASVSVLLQSFGKMFELSLRIALPIVGALFLVDVALGIVARAVPQINVFFVGFPVKIGLGVALLIVVLPVYIGFMTVLFGGSGEMQRWLLELIAAVSPNL